MPIVNAKVSPIRPNSLKLTQVSVGTLKATLITAGIPTVFVDAEEIGYTGTELREQIISSVSRTGETPTKPRMLRLSRPTPRARKTQR